MYETYDNVSFLALYIIMSRSQACMCLRYLNPSWAFFLFSCRSFFFFLLSRIIILSFIFHFRYTVSSSVLGADSWLYYVMSHTRVSLADVTATLTPLIGQHTKDKSKTRLTKWGSVRQQKKKRVGRLFFLNHKRHC